MVDPISFLKLAQAFEEVSMSNELGMEVEVIFPGEVLDGLEGCSGVGNSSCGLGEVLVPPWFGVGGGSSLWGRGV